MGRPVAAASERTLFVSPSAARRRAHALAFLSARAPSERLIVCSATLESAADLIRERARTQPAAFGWHRQTLQGLAAALAAPLLAARGLSPLGGLSLEALCARLLHQEAGRLPTLGPLAALPGTPRALARTLRGLRLDRVQATALQQVSPEVALLLAGYEAQLASGRFADRAAVLALAAERLAQGGHELAGLPVLLLDVPVATAAEAALVAALAAQAEVTAIAPAADAAVAPLSLALGVEPTPDTPAPAGLLGALQRHLFASAAPPESEPGEGLVLFSAPGEGRECVEIARRLLEEAARGVPFDRMAVLLRAPGLYRAALEEALARAGVPVYFARGSLQPDPAGRAFLALLACRASGLSAHGFSDYLSLGEVPDLAPVAGTASPLVSAQSASQSGDEPGSPALARALAQASPEATQETEESALDAGDPSAPVRGATWRWQKLITEAAVIGGGDPLLARERWTRRLGGLRNELERKSAELLRGGDEATVARTRKGQEDLDALCAYSFPLLDRLLALPASASWGEWLPHLAGLAQAGLRTPARVLALLAGLEPLGPVGPVTLAEVQQVLARRLGELQLPPPSRRQGRVFAGPIESARGLSFEAVFAPGLAERLFPQKLIEDPLLPDAVRARLAGATTDAQVRTARERFAQERVDEERLHLRLAAGAASRTLCASWPRLDLAQGARPRVPSFYALELARAGEGRLPGFGLLQLRAAREAEARAAWPAPKEAQRAIDAQEFDLALIDELLSRPEAPGPGMKGHLRYLMSVNPALARALRQRARRPKKLWLPTDGLVDPSPEARAALGKHQLAARAYSPTALQNYSKCPYRFLLSAIHRLEPREEPQAIDAIAPMSRGSLLHEVQYCLLTQLSEEQLLPLFHADEQVRGRRLERAREVLKTVLEAVAETWKDLLAPAIDRVWADGVASIDADLRGWLDLASQEPRWAPYRFELAFGLPDRGHHDAHSTLDPAALDSGLRLRGSIDLVERSLDGGALRATDSKTGKVRAAQGMVIDGGEVLQPALYALVLEKLESARQEQERAQARLDGREPVAEPAPHIEAGRLYYCTHVGDYTEVVVPLGPPVREAVKRLGETLHGALTEGFFPAAPGKDECRYCDFREVCGDGEEKRAARKPKDRLAPLLALRSEP